MNNDHDKKFPEGEDEALGKNAADDVVSDDLEGMDAGPYGETGDDLADLMRTRKSNISLVMFLVGLVIILGIVGYILVNEGARAKVAGFIRGDLFKLEKQRAEDLQRLYQEKLEMLGEKLGSIRLEYFPRDAVVHIYQTVFRYDDIDDKTAEQWGSPTEIPNLTLNLGEGEELPFLSIENLPVRERGKMCLSDKQFYPASMQFCPGYEKCKERKGSEREEEGGSMAEECKKNVLKAVQYCPQDEKYYVDETGGVMVCPDGKTLMDPAKVPVFVFRYDFLFERKDFISQVVSYNENDWIHLGSGKYIIQFPRDFALLRAWGPVKEKYAQARQKMRCWRLEWEDVWEDLKRSKVLTLVKERIAQEAKEKEERTHAYKTRRERYLKTLAAVDVVTRVKQMATIRNGMAEIFYYCPELGKCDPVKMKEMVKTLSGGTSVAELDDYGKGVYYGVLFAMKNPPSRWDGMEEWLGAHPVTRIGLDCLQAWVRVQKEGQFVRVKEARCEKGMESLRTLDPNAYTAFSSMFFDPAAGQAALLANKDEIDAYLLSVDEYEGTEKYEDLTFRIESSGRFLEYLIQAVMYDYNQFTDAMSKYAQSRQVNYRRDCEKRGVVPSDPFRGLKEAVELAWYTGSRLAYDDWYYKLWAQDVQGCLLFAREHDKARYERDLARFEEMVGAEKLGLREQAKGFKDFLRSLRNFEVARPLLREANALYRKDRKKFFSLYTESRMEEIKVSNPELYGGLLYLYDPKRGKAYFNEISKLPEVAEWEVPKKEGDQKLYHKYLAYMELFAPEKLRKGLQTLASRMEPMLMRQEEYELLRESQPYLPPYDQAIQDIVNNDIHLKYFWLLKLLESPSKFDQEFRRLELREALEVARWIDPARYVYLSDLVWLKETVNRYNDAVPMLVDALSLDYGLYNLQMDKLKSWCFSKSQILKKYRRGRKLAESWLKEPTQVEKAVDKALKGTNRFALLLKHLQDYEEAVLSTHMGNVIDELREEIDSSQRDSYAKHVETTNEKIRMDAGFSKREWESLTKEFEKTAANAEWYSALTESLAARRPDCSKVKFPRPKDWEKEIKL